MRATQRISDKFTISLSTICVVHCFFAPSFLVLFSSFESIQYDNELIHLLFLLMTVPVSFFALTLGLKNHKKSSFFLIGILGLSVLILALILGQGILGELGEKLVTLGGSIIVVFAHFKNYQTCIQTDCSCHVRSSEKQSI
tara:strand:+ start:556 stop:978 length:423 start_codon:yes stop_codon:yes gene_type:complete